MNKKAANIQTLTRLDQLEAQVTAAAEAQSLTISDVRDTIHAIADQVVEIAKALPAIIEKIDQIARWVAANTEPAPPLPIPPDAGAPPAKKRAKK